MKLFVAVMAGTSAWDAQPIFASADPDIVGAVVDRLNNRLVSTAAPVAPRPASEETIVVRAARAASPTLPLVGST